MATYPNAGLTRGWAKGPHGQPCDVELCTRTATHCFDVQRNPKGPFFRNFVPFRKDQRAVAGPIVCEIDAMIIEATLNLLAEPDEHMPNSDPHAPTWESTLTERDYLRSRR